MHDKVYSELKTALMEAKFEPGSQLSLRGLAKVFGVSVAPVRAALLRLMAEKAVVQNATTTGNFYVPQLSEDEFEEIIQLRSLLEGLAGEQSSSKITESELDELNKLAEQLREASTHNQPEKYLRANRNFKFTVIAAAGAPVLQDVIESLWIRIGPLMHYYAHDLQYQGDTDCYFEVVEALQRKDGKSARIYMAKDVITGAQFLREAAGFYGRGVPKN